jgi:transposase InsO family protein
MNLTRLERSESDLKHKRYRDFKLKHLSAHIFKALQWPIHKIVISFLPPPLLSPWQGRGRLALGERGRTPPTRGTGGSAAAVTAAARGRGAAAAGEGREGLHVRERENEELYGNNGERARRRRRPRQSRGQIRRLMMNRRSDR